MKFVRRAKGSTKHLIDSMEKILRRGSRSSDQFVGQNVVEM